MIRQASRSRVVRLITMLAAVGAELGAMLGVRRMDPVPLDTHAIEALKGLRDEINAALGER